MSNLVPIGRFSQITRLSIKALRLYAEQGLLCPEYVDPDSGYRYYGLRQAEMAIRIRLLRSLEMPLEDIREVIRAGDAEVLRMLLAQHQERISEQVAKYQRILVLLQRLLENKEELVSYTIKVKEVTAQPIAGIRMRIDPTTYGESIPSPMIELIDYTERLGVRRRDLPHVVIHYDYSEEEADIEAAVPIERAIAGEGRIVSNTLQGGTVASIMHVGPYEELGVIYPALATWIQEHGHEMAGAPYEMF